MSNLSETWIDLMVPQHGRTSEKRHKIRYVMSDSVQLVPYYVKAYIEIAEWEPNVKK